MIRGSSSSGFRVNPQLKQVTLTGGLGRSRYLAQAIAESKNEMRIAGPANCAAACPVRTKIPAPTIAPTPSEVRSKKPSVGFRR